MSETIGLANMALQGADMVRSRTLDVLLLGVTAGLLYMWWTAHTSDMPTPLVPNQDVSDIAEDIPASIYSYNMPFYGAQRRRIQSPNMPSPTRTPNNPSSQPTFAPADKPDEMPGPVELVAEY